LIVGGGDRPTELHQVAGDNAGEQPVEAREADDVQTACGSGQDRQVRLLHGAVLPLRDGSMPDWTPALATARRQPG
jgi:hypothetical protein